MALTARSSPTASGSNASTVQCLVSNLALYPLPANLRMESIDFENLILQHVKNNLYARNDNSPSASGADSADLTRDMIEDTEEHNLAKQMERCTGEIKTSAQREESSAHTGHHFVVSLESDRLAWAALKSPLEDGQSSVEGFDYSRHCCHYMTTCLSEIKLCYVNIQLPNIIIWLLSSIPRKIVKARESSSQVSSTDGQHQQHENNKLSQNKSALFALVLQCFREVDVVSMRQAYKHLRSMQKQTTQHQHQQHFLVKKEMVGEGSAKKSTEVEVKKSNQATKAGHHILSRQRIPAKLIHEDTSFNLKNVSNNSPAATTTSSTKKPTAATSVIQLSQKKKNPAPMSQMNSSHIRSYFSNHSTSSESEFDTTQINTYLSQSKSSQQHSGLIKSQQQNGSSNSKARTRSRSVESPRHRQLRLLYKPIDDIDVLIPSAYGLRASESTVLKRGLNKSRPSMGASLKGGGKGQRSAKENSSYFTDSLNSEGSSLSDESTSGDFPATGNFELDQLYFNQLASKLRACKHGEQLSPKAGSGGHPIVIKSALKKSSSYLEGQSAVTNYRSGGYGGLFFRSTSSETTSTATREQNKSVESRAKQMSGKGARHWANNNCTGKKNVTFSAYATIQVVDN